MLPASGDPNMVLCWLTAEVKLRSLKSLLGNFFDTFVFRSSRHEVPLSPTLQYFILDLYKGGLKCGLFSENSKSYFPLFLALCITVE